MNDIHYLSQPVERGMERCKQQFDSFMTHSNPLLHEILQKVSMRKGKMMRPLLTLLAAKLFGEIDEKCISTAISFEFFHTASLIHDDIVDESDQRRGSSSVNSAYSNKIAVLVGDFILANALLSATRGGDTRLVEILSETAQRLTSGELLQLQNISNEAISEEVYFSIIDNKTAALFAACAEAGAMTAAASADDVRTMRRFGEAVGVCFQIKDDIFDYVAGTEIGKPTGNDMREGKLTLPLIHALFAAGDERMFDLAYKIKGGRISSDEIDALVRFTLRNGGIEYAQRKMEKYADEAKGLLEKYPDCAARRALLGYVDYAIQRSF